MLLFLMALLALKVFALTASARMLLNAKKVNAAELERWLPTTLNVLLVVASMANVNMIRFALVTVANNPNILMKNLKLLIMVPLAMVVFVSLVVAVLLLLVWVIAATEMTIWLSLMVCLAIMEMVLARLVSAFLLALLVKKANAAMSTLVMLSLLVSLATLILAKRVILALVLMVYALPLPKINPMAILAPTMVHAQMVFALLLLP
jgi:hypothetical protein